MYLRSTKFLLKNHKTSNYPGRVTVGKYLNSGIIYNNHYRFKVNYK